MDRGREAERQRGWRRRTYIHRGDMDEEKEEDSAVAGEDRGGEGVGPEEGAGAVCKSNSHTKQTGGGRGRGERGEEKCAIVQDDRRGREERGGRGGRRRKHKGERVGVIHIHIHMRIHIHMHMHVHIHIHIHRQTVSHRQSHIHTYIHRYIHTYIHRYMHTYIRGCPSIHPMIHPISYGYSWEGETHKTK